MAGWSKPTASHRDTARQAARALGHTVAGPFRRVGLSEELYCSHCHAYVSLPYAYARMAWEPAPTMTGPAVREFCPGAGRRPAVPQAPIPR